MYLHASYWGKPCLSCALDVLRVAGNKARLVLVGSRHYGDVMVVSFELFEFVGVEFDLFAENDCFPEIGRRSTCI